MRYSFTCVALMFLSGCTNSPATFAPPAPTIHEEMVAYPAGTEKLHGFLCRPARDGRFPAIVVVHGDFGLDDWVKNQARRLAAKDYVVLAVDLYRGEVVKDVMDAHIMDRALPEERIQGDLRAAIDHLAGCAYVRPERIGIIGWDSGGGYALDCALQEPRLRTVVTCYGRLTTDSERLKHLQASVLGIFAGKDEGIGPDTIAQFRQAMSKAGKRVVDLQVYPDCGHGFMAEAMPSQSNEDAWRRIETCFAHELQ